MGPPMRIELIRIGFLVYIANYYTTRGAPDDLSSWNENQWNQYLKKSTRQKLIKYYFYLLNYYTYTQQATRVQILDEAVSNTHSANTLGKGMIPTVLPTAINK